MAANFALRSALRGGRSARDHALGLRSCLGAKVSDLVGDSSSAVSPFGRATGSGCNGCNLMQYVEKGLCTTGSRLSSGLLVKSYFCSNPSTSLSSSGARFFCTKKEVPDEHIKKVDAFLKQYQRDRVFMSTGLELIVKEVLLLKEEVAQSDYVQKRLTKILKDTFLLSAGQIESIGHAWTVVTYFFGAIALVSLLFSVVKTVQENDVPYTDYIHLLNAIRSQALDRGISLYKAERVEREDAKKLKSVQLAVAKKVAEEAAVERKAKETEVAALRKAELEVARSKFKCKKYLATAAARQAKEREVRAVKLANWRQTNAERKALAFARKAKWDLADAELKSKAKAAAAKKRAEVDELAAAVRAAAAARKNRGGGGAAAAAALSADVPPKSDDAGAAAAAALSADVPPKSDDAGAAAAAALSADVPLKSDDAGGAAAAAALSADVPPKSDDATAALSADVPPKSDDAGAAAAAALSADVPPKSDDAGGGAAAAAALSADVPPKSDDAAAALSADVPPKSDDAGAAGGTVC
ncbi:hypothetical protein ZWY2020_021211 [Hordeum vulgare]|nr:hypothetical protein ZWY2020_021211 [Hordeum vulgare]